MVNFILTIKADLKNLTHLQPAGGCDNPNFTYLFKVKCTACGETSAKESYLSLKNTVFYGTQSRKTFRETGSYVGRETTNLVQKCKSCENVGRIKMIPGEGMPLTQENAKAKVETPLMLFDCWYCEPVEFTFGGGWEAVSLDGTRYDNIDLSEKEFTGPKEEGKDPVMIDNLEATFRRARYVHGYDLQYS